MPGRRRPSRSCWPTANTSACVLRPLFHCISLDESDFLNSFLFCIWHAHTHTGLSGVTVPVAMAKITMWPAFLALIVRASIETFDPVASSVVSVVLYSWRQECKSLHFSIYTPFRIILCVSYFAKTNHNNLLFFFQFWTKTAVGVEIYSKETLMEFNVETFLNSSTNELTSDSSNLIILGIRIVSHCQHSHLYSRDSIFY